MTKSLTSPLTLVVLTLIASSGAFVDLQGEDVTLGNDLFNITFQSNATAKTLFKNGVNLIDNIPYTLQKWYLDWDGEKVYFSPTRVEVVRNSSEESHVVYIQEASEGLLYIEFHLVVLDEVSGLYQYIKVSNPTNASISLAEFRTVHRFNHDLMPKVSNMVQSGDIVPNVVDRPTIQDTTWQLVDGRYWSKYDLCGYIRETPWIGVYGGGFGAWIVTASREYHSAGPLKQELLVHHDSLMLNYFHSSHFGTPNLDAPTGWSKFYGPVLIYFNTGSDEDLLNDVSRQAQVEEAQWPYQWVNEDNYPLERGSVSGAITGQTKAMVVLYDSLEEEFDLQTLGYLYHTKTDERGNFTIRNIRPGAYQVVAYPIAGQGSENLARKNLTVKAKEVHDIGTLDLPEPKNILWSLGETDRRSSEYHYSDEMRNFYWHLLPPANITFQIGQSQVSKNWYYAQTKTPGVWRVTYEDKPDAKGRLLRVAFAAASNSTSITIYINGNRAAHYIYDNDHTIYRDALQSGRFHSEKVEILADAVVDGENEVAFALERGMVMYDAVSLGRD